MLWQYLGRKSHCWKAHFFKICFFVKYFSQWFLSLVNMGLHAAIIWLSPLIHEGEQRYKPYILGDPWMVTPPLKNPGYAPAIHHICTTMCRAKRVYPLLVRQILFYTSASPSVAFNASTPCDGRTRRTSRGRFVHSGQRHFPVSSQILQGLVY